MTVRTWTGDDVLVEADYDDGTIMDCEHWKSLVEFSPDRQYRYMLARSWNLHDPPLVFVMLNPSVADVHRNDPTVERCQRRALALGAGGLVILNLFAFRSPEPERLYTHPDPVGPKNDERIVAALRASRPHTPRVVIGWGDHGRLHGRGDRMVEMLHEEGAELLAFVRNASGQPCHPLYLPYVMTPKPWGEL
jgi:hypothetical protein